MNTIWRPTLAGQSGPKYKALAAALREGVGRGALAPGAKLPPVRELAWQLEITPGTVARAYSILVDAGVFEATVGRGTFVAAAKEPALIGSGKPIEEDGVPHGSGGMSGEASFFSPALPNLGQASLIKELMAKVAQDPPSGLMHYPTRAAFRPAREAVVDWIRGTPLGPLDQEDVVLSHGGQNGITLILQSILKGQKPVVLVEELTYPGFRRAAELLRAEVIPVPMDDDGIIPDALEEIARREVAQVLCTSPEVHNPTCHFTPEARRREIVEVARRVDFQILEDDCYRLGHSRAPSYRMLAPDRGWYVSSISKTLTPALRIGYAMAPPGQGAQLRRVAEHGFFGLATPLADLTALLLRDPRAEAITRKVNAEIEVYVRSMVNHLGSFALTWRETVPIAWLRLPEGWRATSFCQAAADRGIKIRPAEDFINRDARAPHAVRLSINAQLPFDRFEAAMEDLRSLLENPPEAFGV